MAKNNQSNVSETDTINAAATETTQNEGSGTAAPTEKARYEGVTAFVYVGPSLPGGRLKSNTVLSGTYAEIAEYFKDAIALHPSVARLIVPVSRLAEAREKTQNSGNAMYKYYTEVTAAISAKGEEK